MGGRLQRWPPRDYPRPRIRRAHVRWTVQCRQLPEIFPERRFIEVGWRLSHPSGKQSFASESTQHEIEILVPLLRVIQEPLTHLCSDIARSAPGHVSISRYGRITFPTRQILA
jgi:uncharacterized lipoprotein YmbA